MDDKMTAVEVAMLIFIIAFFVYLLGHIAAWIIQSIV